MAGAQPPILSRRSVLKVGLFGALTLALIGGLYRATREQPVEERFVLDGAARSALAAIIPVMLADAIPQTASSVELAVGRVLDAIAGLPLATQAEIQDLFSLLTLGPARRFLAGLPDDWTHARTDDVAGFLQRWREHRFALLQSAYHALHDLITGSWYADESTWASIGYPGPLQALG
jgi:hypothetical protein